MKKKNIAQHILISSVQAYQKTLSPDHSFWAKNLGKPPYCKHFPTCSDYMIEAIEKKGVIVGVGKGIWRLLRCNPWSRGGYDPVEKEKYPKNIRLFGENNYTSTMENRENLLQKNHNIGQYAGYKTRVLAKYFFVVSSQEDIHKLGEIYAFSQAENLPILVMSGGTNMLFATDFFDGIVIKNELSGWEYDDESKILVASSNSEISEIAQMLEEQFHQPLWHRFIGLPGSVAGAVVGNAGCFGLETEGNFVSVRVFNMQKGEFVEFSHDEMQFDYRSSFLKGKENFFVISAKFNLSEKREKYSSDIDNIDFRENKQPKGNSCGSFFKNPSREFSAGYLIEQAGLKGYRHGGARWSELHANFLFSDGENCKPSDLIELVRLTQKKVFEQTGIHLVNEVKIIE